MPGRKNSEDRDRAPKRKAADQVSGNVPRDEDDDGESVLSGRSRERQPGVPGGARPAADPRSADNPDEASSRG